MGSAKNEYILLRWMTETRHEKVIIRRTVLQEKSKFFEDVLNFPEFQCFSGWLLLAKNFVEEAAIDDETV